MKETVDIEKIKIIVECDICKDLEEKIQLHGEVKYKLPSIGCYVVEVPERVLPVLEGVNGIRAIHKNTHIMAQMQSTRKIINADKNSLTGRGITIAILDTGVAPVDDLVCPINRLLAFKDFVNGKSEPYDDNAHGTHVAAIAAGNGFHSDGKYMGIASQAGIVAIKILDEQGKGNAADVLAGIQWMIDNKDIYNIRVANLSIGTLDIGSRDPLVKAVEAAWDEGIVMTIAAGNNGPTPCTVTSPGISRKVITVGASDDNSTVTVWGDSLVNFSGRGPTSECIMKPDIIAPGANIISCMTFPDKLDKKRLGELKIVSEHYVKMSGTSMATPMVTGAIALLLEQYPKMKPNDVKYLLKQCARSIHYPQNQQGWGLLDIENLLLQEEVYVG